MTPKTTTGLPRRFLPYHYFHLPIHQGRKLTEEHKKKTGHSGSKHWNYKGGKGKHNAGYIRRLSDNGKRDNRVLEHRLIYEEYYKCCLMPWIHIHHVNGDKQDNRPDNLRPVTKAHHRTLHKKDMSKRKCFLCGRKDEKYWHKDEGEIICGTCYKRNRRKLKHDLRQY